MSDPEDKSFFPPMRRGRGRRKGWRRWEETQPEIGKEGFPRRKRIGRPRSNPLIHFPWENVSGHVTLFLNPQEVEVLRFLDDEELTQQQTAEKMGVSRATVWRLAQSARKKIIQALLSGDVIHVVLTPYESQKTNEEKKDEKRDKKELDY